MVHTPTPPVPPALHLWPAAIRSAELLRGSAVRCGPGLRLLSWPETPSVRAAALGDALTSNRIAAHLTAAWVWGASRDPGRSLEFIVRRGRAHFSSPLIGVVLHQYKLLGSEVVLCSGRAVTSPSRTLYDLLRAPLFLPQHRVACRLLLTHFLGGRADWAASLTEAHHRVDPRLLRRLESV